MKLQRVNLVAAILLGFSYDVCTRQPPSASASARLLKVRPMPAWVWRDVRSVFFFCFFFLSCSECGLVVFLPNRCCLRLILLGTCIYIYIYVYICMLKFYIYMYIFAHGRPGALANACLGLA